MKPIVTKIVTKQDLIDQVYQDNHYTRNSVEDIIQQFLNAFSSALVSGQEVRLPEIGTIKSYTRKAYVGHNPLTNEPLPVPQQRMLTIKGAPYIRDALNPTN